LVRASAVVKRHRTVAWSALRRSAYAVIAWASVARSGTRRSRHWAARTLGSISTAFGQIPCLGAWCYSSLRAVRCASAGPNAS
jgi:hypothetical protein